ncbi:hypothetical protein [Nocardia vinacea]|uniref:hypothetical protein n=1 Tax=Nocardia vinacea TaxID=96468 RepID=UPI0002F1CDFC|nr:hypothetical protein [Nocardia vinacea]
MRIIVDQHGVTFLGEDGILLTYPHTAPNVAVTPLNGGQRWTLTRMEDGGYRITDPDSEIIWHFHPNSGLGGIDTSLGNYAITGITDRHQNWIHPLPLQQQRDAHRGDSLRRVSSTGRHRRWSRHRTVGVRH